MGSRIHLRVDVQLSPSVLFLLLRTLVPLPALEMSLPSNQSENPFPGTSDKYRVEMDGKGGKMVGGERKKVTLDVTPDYVAEEIR
jgi:hypothetical protein